MNKNEDFTALIDKAVAGDRESLETFIVSVRDLVFNLSLRMLTPEAYRQRLSRIRRKVADFLSAYCGEYGSGKCQCRDRLNYAIQSHRLNPAKLDYTTVRETPADMEKALGFKSAMEEIDDLSEYFSFIRLYESPEQTKRFLTEFLESASLSTVKNA